MNTADAERLIREQLVGVYEEEEAMNIANLSIEFICGFTKTERLFDEESALNDDQVKKLYLGRNFELKRKDWLLEEAGNKGRAEIESEARGESNEQGAVSSEQRAVE